MTEKEFERNISILSQVKEKGYPVTLRLIGAIDDSSYSQRIAKAIERHDWITPEGFLSLIKKQEILASQRFALHA